MISPDATAVQRSACHRFDGDCSNALRSPENQRIASSTLNRRRFLQCGGCHSALGASNGLSIRSIRACLAHDNYAVPIRGFAPWLVGGFSRAGPTVGRVGFARWLRAGIVWVLAHIEALFPRLGSPTSHGPWPRAWAWARQVSARPQATLRSSSRFFRRQRGHIFTTKSRRSRCGFGRPAAHGARPGSSPVCPRGPCDGML